MKVVCVHLLNDRSGSPRVLRNSILAMKKNDYEVSLLIGSSGQGILSDVGVNTKKYFYKRFDNKFMTLMSYLFSQLCLFILLVSSKEYRAADVVYINTIMPFSAGFFGFIFRKKVFYHVHEVSVGSRLLSKFLKWVIKLTADKVVFVSKVHGDLFPIECRNKSVVYNGYDNMFTHALNAKYKFLKNGEVRILMLASLRVYKGVDIFVELAKRFLNKSEFKFELVLNENDLEINKFKRINTVENLTIYGPVSDPSKFYRNASIVLNLSMPDQWIETFGLTIVEAMAFGVPVIVPPVGGPSEVVNDGIEGYLVDSKNINELEDRIIGLLMDLDKVITMSKSARIRSQEFSPAKYEESIIRELTEL